MGRKNKGKVRGRGAEPRRVRSVQGAVDLHLGQIQLGVNRPEQYRAQLLQEIMDEIARIRKLSGSKAILHISGLEDPVQVRQISEEEVELFIDYQLTVEVLEPAE